MQIRQSMLSDAQYLPDIERSAAQLFRQDPTLAYLADGEVQSMQEHSAFIIAENSWVAIIDDSIAGFLNGEMNDHTFHICELSVHQMHQAKGIGRQLMQHIETILSKRNIPQITLTTFIDLPWNAPFYQKLGFNRISDDNLSAYLSNILKQESAAGLDINRRCAMKKVL